MNTRYSSVDRTKELKYRKIKNPLFLGGSLILGNNDFDVNKIITNTRNNSIKVGRSQKTYPKKLPSLTKKIKNNKIFDILSKNSDLSTTANNAFSFEKENNEKSNYNYLKTESNNDPKITKYFNIIIHSNLTERTSIYNTQSSSITNFIKPIVKEKKLVSYNISRYPNERLYKKSDNKDNIYNSLKLIKEIKNNSKNDKNTNERINNLAYDSKYENIVFDADKIINNYKFRENELKVPDNGTSDFLSKNKEISINNVLIELIQNENKKIKTRNENINKNIKEYEKIIEKDEKNFDNISNKQRELYYKISDLLYMMRDKRVELIKLLYYYQTKAKTLEDEIFKKIEQIESLRIYAKFVHKVLGGDEKLFDGDLIPNYENDNRPETDIIVKKIYQKYGHLLKKNKISNISENNKNPELKLSESEIMEDIDIDLLEDPDLMIRKFKELENQILRIVERKGLFNKYEIKEAEDNKQLLKDMKIRIEKLKKKYEKHKKALIDYKNNEFGKTSEISEEDFCIMANDLCKSINKYFINDKKNELKYKNNKTNNIDILELNDDITKCMKIMIKKENEINKLMEIIENFEKNDEKIFNELMNKRKYEVKMINQQKIRENLKNNEFFKKQKIEGRINKITIKLRKCEPPLYFQKKEEKVKIDENEIIQNENEELLTYK